MKLKEIADRIDAHLKRIEHDPKLNAPYKPYAESKNPDHRNVELHRYYQAGAHDCGSKVCLQYVSYQLTSKLTKAEALEYLKWLDAGNVGTHYHALKKFTS